jgi:hypothetical protein
MKTYAMVVQNVLRDAGISVMDRFICKYDMTDVSIAMNAQLPVHVHQMLYPGSLRVLHIYQKM